MDATGTTRDGTNGTEDRMGRTFSMTRRVQFAETDMAGVLHFANYFRFMEEIEHAFWRSHGRSVVTREEHREVSWPRVAVACEYFAPAHFEDELELTLTVANVGERSVTYEVDFRRAGQRTALGRMTAVCCEATPGKFRAIAIPDDVRQTLTQAAGATR